MFDETSPSLSHFLLLQMMVIIFKINVHDKLVEHILAIGPRLCSPQLKLGLKTLVNNSIYPPRTQENLSFVYQVSYHKSSVRLYIPLNHIKYVFHPFCWLSPYLWGTALSGSACNTSWPRAGCMAPPSHCSCIAIALATERTPWPRPFSRWAQVLSGDGDLPCIAIVLWKPCCISWKQLGSYETP